MDETQRIRDELDSYARLTTRAVIAGELEQAAELAKKYDLLAAELGRMDAELGALYYAVPDTWSSSEWDEMRAGLLQAGWAGKFDDQEKVLSFRAATQDAATETLLVSIT